VLNLVRNNFTLKVVSVCLALAAWGYFHLAAAPGTTARFDQTLSVPIVVTGLKPGYQARYTDKVATVVIEVPRNGTAIKPDQVQAVLDVGDLVDPGFHNVPVKIVSPDVAIKSLSPASVTLGLDRLEERAVPVSVDYVGDRRSVVVESAEVNPATTTIRGVATDLTRVTGVRVEIPIPAKPEPFDKMIRPTPIDARGTEIPGVQISPNFVRVRAHFVAPSGQGTHK
jgi:YbbR domain-containing protein